MRGIHASGLNFDDVRAEFELPTAFDAAVEREAATVPDAFAHDRIDARDIPFVTIDPPGSRDLDQAVHLTRHDSGFTLRYAIADVAAFVRPGSLLHAEAMRRGQTVYLPDGNVPLHPRALSEDRASLLPDADRPCVLWTIETDRDGNVTSFEVARARIRSRAKLTYAEVQADVDAGRALPDALAALPEFGRVRQQRAIERGAIELRLPAQDIAQDDDGQWHLQLEPRTTVDEWNAECSLVTGQCAAQLMVRGGVGLLRTLPAPDQSTLQAFRDAAGALGFDWPAGVGPGAFLASLHTGDVRTLALMSAATRLLRGSGYVAFAPSIGGEGGGSDGSGSSSGSGSKDGVGVGAGVPSAERRWHAGVATEYAHATAPLRRLADRFSLEICLAIADGREPDADLLAELPDVPGRMASTSQIAGSVSNACLNKAEALVLRDRVGDEFEAAVLRASTDKRDAEVFVADPPIVAGCSGHPPVGRPIRVFLAAAEPDARDVRFEFRGI